MHRVLLAALAALPSLAVAQDWIDPTLHSVSADLTHGQRAIAHDLTGDGIPDLLASYSLADAVYLFVNDGAANWSRVEIASDVVAMWAVPVDADCDGDDDVAAVELFDRDFGFETAGRLVWYERPGDVMSPNWQEHLVDDTLVHFNRVDAGDIDGDGDADLIAGTRSSNADNVLVWYENRCGEGGERWTRRTIVSGFDFGACGSARLTDLDDDGDLDVLAADSGGNQIVWYEYASPGDAPWPIRPIAPVAGGASAARPHDIDGDGDLDVVAALGGPGQVVWLEHPDGDPRTTWAMHAVGDLPGATDIAVGDFNNDRVLDVVAGSTEEAFGGSNLLRVYTGNGDDTFTQRMDTDYFSFTSVDAADLDGDGDDDFVTASYGADAVDWWENRFDPATPVRLESFTAIATAAGVEIRWSSGYEFDHAGYRLHRATLDGSDARPVGPALIRPDAAVGRTYTIVDDGLAAGASAHYRLTSVDVEGHEVVVGVIRAQAAASPIVALSPNPARTGVAIRIDGADQGATIFDATGRRVRTLAPHARLSWDARTDGGTRVAPGVYFVEPAGGDQAARHRLVIVR